MLNRKRESSHKTEESHENKNKKKKYEPKIKIEAKNELNQINIEFGDNIAEIPLIELSPKKDIKESSPKKVSEKENLMTPKDEPKLKLETSIKPSLPILNTHNIIRLTIDNNIQKFYTPETNLEKVEEKFKIFLKKKNSRIISDKDKLETLNEILEICEINPEYNYYYLKYYQKCFDNISLEFR